MAGQTDEASSPALEVTDLRVVYQVRRSLFSWRNWPIFAVDGVSFQLARGETLALVGESGSGKSTIARATCGLVTGHGTVRLNGVVLTGMTRRERRRVARQLQMVFQNPYSSLDPSMTVGASVAEPFEIHTSINKEDRDQRVAGLLQKVGLDPSLADYYPRALSGGQRQRVAIARSIALDPAVLICDEALSALDVSTQTQVAGLIRRLVDDIGIACLFITHDLARVPELADRIAVIYAGRIVEEGSTEAVLTNPQHPYTKVLLAAVPVPDPIVQKSRPRSIPPEPATSFNRPPGCPFHPRCAVAIERCRVDVPPLDVLDAGHRAACHLVTRMPKPTPRTSNAAGPESELPSSSAGGAQ